MDIRKRFEGNVAILRLEGQLDLTSASTLKEASREILENDTKKIVLNLDKVDFINSSGLGALVSVLKDVRNARGSMRISNLAPYVKEIFDVTQLSNIFEIFHDENQAITSF